MKKLLTTICGLLTCLFLLAFGSQDMTITKEITITGKVTDSNNQALIGANILIKGTTAGTVSDIDGKYKLTCPSATTIIVECRYLGFKNISKTVKTEDKTELILDFQLTETEILLEEVVLSKERIPSIEKSTSYSIASPPTTKTYSRTSAEADYLSSPAPAAAYDKKSMPKSSIKYISSPSSTSSSVSGSTRPTRHAGTLTAGEIHDFSKWELWQDVAAEDLNEWVDTWNYHLTHRYVVQILTEDGFPLTNALVDLKKGKKTLWTARTDNTGKAELWANVFTKNDTKAAANLQIDVQYNGKKHHIEQVKTFQEGINFLRLNENCKTPNAIDIMFVVDATSSMRDELSYIQAELYDVVQRVQNLRKEMTIHLGSVFYRDEGDEYLTRKSDLSSDINQTIDFIKKQQTAGGGDYPEAVESALQVAIEEMTWSDGNATKLLFLVLDAPPHETPTILKDLERFTKKAAAKGIRIIPIASSGVNKSTEYLLRSFALSTNGTYVFLTNHSGVGNAHIEPSTDEYSVEKLNDLLIRVIKQFTQTVDCESTVNLNVLQNNKNQNQTIANTVFKCYPNPNEGIFTIELEKPVKELFITDGSGKNLLRFKDLQEGKTRVDLSNFPSGMYIVRCLQDKKLLSEKVVVIGEGMVRNN